MNLPIRSIPLAMVTLALLLLPSLVVAQERQPAISVGDRVRLYSADADTLRAAGRVERLEPGRIFLVPEEGGGAMAAPLTWNDVLAVRRSVPVGQNVRRRGIWGAFLGGSIGGIAAPFAMRSGDSAMTGGQAVLIGAGAGAVMGAGIGALLGYLVPGHRWEYVRVEYELTGIPRAGS